MIDSETLFDTVDPDFEESIRIDRELTVDDESERREQLYGRYLDNYYLTDASADFLAELVSHLRDANPAPDERNHWLYGYYGSGKSHLLTALDLLLDTRTLAETEMASVWGRFDDQRAHSGIGDAWMALHDDIVVVPLPINLLRYQSVRDQTFSEIILQTVYAQRGFADRLDVAFFEEEFQRTGGLYDTKDVWDDRERLLNDILREEGVQNPDYDWADVRQYRILSDIILEGLTEQATGMTENLADIQNRNVGQELAVRTIESYRQGLQQEFDRTVKIALLMDEVTLFIGGDYQRLSELNALAESISDIGEGNIFSVVTAQSNIEDVQPGLATKQLDFGILKDRFPQQYELPSRHVGEIVQQRLLTKSYNGREWIEEEALTASVHPQTMLVYREVTQNTEPRLDEIESEAFIEYYPLLPYQPALFMEILSNLRSELADATKSIFSGTARAILSLVAGLRELWAEKDGEKPIISLVDFYNLVQYELEDIIPEKTAVIEDIAQERTTTNFDLQVAKAVLLLSYVPDMVPQNDANLAAAVIDDLEGSPRANVQTRVRESLEGNLEKYIRPDTSTDGSDLRLTDREEQQLITTARNFETDPDWDQIIVALDDQLWDTITSEIDPPQAHDYTNEDDGTAYPVTYQYTIDDQELEDGDEDAVFEIDVVIRGLRPDVDDDHIAPETLYWIIETEGIDELRSQLVEWWALTEATASTNPPESLIRDRTDAANRVTEKLTAALKNGHFRVEASEFTSIEAALEDYINEAYPSYFDPELTRIDDSHLDELRQLEDGAELPDWAQSIGVPQQSTNDFATFSDIAFELRRLVGTQIQDGTPNIDVATVLDRAIEQEPLFARETEAGTEPTPAALAVLWGLCRAGVFRLTTVDGDPAPVDQLLVPPDHTTLTLTPVPQGTDPKDVFVDHDIIEPTESANQGYVNFNDLLERIENRANSLAEQIAVQIDTTFETDTLTPIIKSIENRAKRIEENANKRQSQALTDDVEELSSSVSATKDDQSALETIETRWFERLSFLLQLEALIRIEGSDIEWFDDEITNIIKTLRDELRSVEDTDWWTDDGWVTFVGELGARSNAIDAIDEAWNEQRRTTDLVTLQSNLDDHPWLIAPMELPMHGVHDGFRVQYLDPLRGFRDTIDQIGDVLEPLTDPEPGRDDEGDLTQALGILNSEPNWSSASQSTVSKRSDQLEKLNRVVGDAAPDDFVGIGLLHDDSDELRSQVEALDSTDGVPELIEINGGVIIR